MTQWSIERGLNYLLTLSTRTAVLRHSIPLPIMKCNFLQITVKRAKFLALFLYKLELLKGYLKIIYLLYISFIYSFNKHLLSACCV